MRSIRVNLFAMAIATVFVSVAHAQAATEQTPQLLWRENRTPCQLTSPLISGDLLFVGTCDGKFYALEKHIGRVLWLHNASLDGASGGFSTRPLLRKGAVITGTSGKCGTSASGYVYAFEPRTGNVKWHAHVAAGSNTFANVDDYDPKSPIIFGTGDGEWVSVAADTGSINWRFRATASGEYCGTRTSIATDGESVCFVAQDQALHCLDAKSGRELWNRKLEAEPTTDVFMYKDGLYFGTANKEIHGVIPINGKPVVQLRTPFTATGGIVDSDKETNDEYEFSYGNDVTGGALISYSDEFDRVVWSRTSAENESSRAPEPWRGLLITGTCSGKVVGHRIRDGKPEWETHVDGCVDAFAHDNASLYIAVREGAIYTYHPPAFPLQERAKD